MQEGNPNLGALEIDPADIPADGNVADPAGREWPTTLQGWREHYRGGGLTYAKAGYLRYSRSPEQGQAARERARALSGQMPKEQYESLFAAPQLPADQPELELGPAFQNPAPPRSAPLNREPADQPELELGPAFQNPESIPSAGGGPSPLVDWIGAARKNRGRVPPEIPDLHPSLRDFRKAMAGATTAEEYAAASAGAAGITAGSEGGAAFGPWGVAAAAAIGLGAYALHASASPEGSIHGLMPGAGGRNASTDSGAGVIAMLTALNKIANIRTRA